jgi:hypothetical protein
MKLKFLGYTDENMAKPRGKEHTTLTETAQEVVSVLRLLPAIKMIAPGIINQNARGGAGSRFVTVVYTKAGFELIITGQGVQKVSVHAEENDAIAIIEALKSSKKLRHFKFKERERKPGV